VKKAKLPYSSILTFFFGLLLIVQKVVFHKSYTQTSNTLIFHTIEISRNKS